MKTQVIITLSITFGFALAGIIVDQYKRRPLTVANLVMGAPAVLAIIMPVLKAIV